MFCCWVGAFNSKCGDCTKWQWLYHIVVFGVPILKTCTFNGWWLFAILWFAWAHGILWWSVVKLKIIHATNSIYMYIILLCNNPRIIQQQPSLKINQLPSKSLTYPPNLSWQQLGNDDFPAVLVGVPGHVAHEFIFCISGPWNFGTTKCYLYQWWINIRIHKYMHVSLV